MTGIVVVSHSRALAAAAVALAQEMVHGSQARIEAAAGLDETTFGTDAVAIMDAITAADDGSGVVVLMDLGSAVLSAELALDLIDPDVRDRVVLCSAPFVEGLMVAAVAAAGGASPAEAAEEALGSLAAKQEHLGPASGPPDQGLPEQGPPGQGSGQGPAEQGSAEQGGPGRSEAGTPGSEGPGRPAEPAVSAQFEIANPHGLHARPAARLVQEARRFDARIRLRNVTTGAGPVPATSLSKVATLGGLRGHVLEVDASGVEAQDALDAVLALARRRFDEPDSPAPLSTTAEPVGDRSSSAADPSERRSPEPESSTAGSSAARSSAVRSPESESSDSTSSKSARPGSALPASPGIAIGPALTLRSADVEIPDEPGGGTDHEWRRVEDAVAVARREIELVRSATAREVGEQEARIFDAHLLLIDDPGLLDDVRERVRAGAAAPRAWTDAVDGAEAGFAALPDPYLRTRAADVHAVGQQVARALVGAGELRVDGEGVLVADDLTPAQVAGLDTALVRGIVLAAGSPTGHCAILARSRAIPTVVAAGPAVLDVAAGTVIGLDGTTGEVVVDPSAEVLRDLHDRAGRASAAAAVALSAAQARARTRDGVEVLVGANLGSVEDARAAAAAGADVSGLVRTEFLFLGRDRAPGADEQVEVYRAMAAALGGRRLTLRTLDVGGDKPLPYAPQPAEANPFLGVRGIRFALAERDLLRDQLAAIVRVAHETPVSVMFPMVSTVEELAEARRRLERAIEIEGRGRPPGLEVGIMVEVPATALKAGAFVADVDFLSIGTNDLTQYALAAERGNPAVAALGDPLDPGVLQLVDAVCRAARGRALVAVCGELAADERAAGLLVAMGVRELSVAPLAVPGVKQAVRRIDAATNPQLITSCLASGGPAEVRALLTAP